MKPHRTWFSGILPLLLFASVPALAQAAISDDEVELRALKPNWTAQKVDGIQIKILKALHPKDENSAFRLINSEHIFKSGDRVRFEYVSNFTGYVYLINIAPSGEKEVIFPRAGLSNRITASQPCTFPPEKDFKFDDEAGTEIVQFVLSRTRIPTLDQAAYANEGKLPEWPEKGVPATVVQAGIVGDGVRVEAGDFEARGVLIAKESNGATIVAVKRRSTTTQKKASGGTVRERKMIIGPKTDSRPTPKKAETASPVITPSVPEKVDEHLSAQELEISDGKLGDKEVLVFEMRLKHQ